MNRPGLPKRLARSLCSTNPIESLKGSIRNTSRNVMRWRNGEQALRWEATTSLNAEGSLRRLYAYRNMPRSSLPLSASWSFHNHPQPRKRPKTNEKARPEVPRRSGQPPVGMLWYFCEKSKGKFSAPLSYRNVRLDK